MGNAESAAPEATYGYRVLGVQASSPASKVGLVSFFDFIVEANGEPLWDKEVSYFVGLIRDFQDKELPLRVYNCKDRSTREVCLIPTTSWAGEGRLGVAIRFDSYLDAADHMCHVLDVEPDSPAELAGLSPNGTDYLLGTAEIGFSDTDVLHDELRLHVDRTVEFYVYSSETDDVRVVVLLPNTQWGGSGSSILGASVACGFLHRLPTSCCGTTGHSSDVALRPGGALQGVGAEGNGNGTPVKQKEVHEFGQSP